ncbi:MAG: 3-phosphoshikimate 1-carboxyvinyltransferase [Chloroflexi bacterium]|nr:MAG: 3-phosphoshikimate 1-carboxyvinyltransferase [Chloroflexota bacterium]
MQETITPVTKVDGTISLPGDKSISHRSLMISAVAEGQSEIENLSHGQDVQSTRQCLEDLGVEIIEEEHRLIVNGVGLTGLQNPHKVLDVGNSGTTIRLISGILAGQSFNSVLTGDDSIKQRPMSRIITPLRQMGIEVSAENDEYAPIKIHGGEVKAIEYQSPVASAQVKSCVMFAGLFAQGRTVVYEKAATRDHTELMLSKFGASVNKEGLKVSVDGQARLQGQQVFVPGDISSAAYFIAAALLIPDGSILIKNVGINPTRRGLLELLADFGANIDIINVRTVDNELMADLFVKHSQLQGMKIEGAMIPQVIDEIPILAVLATQADGVTEISDAEELRFKESDRLRSMCFNLQRMGAKVEEKKDGLIIDGNASLSGAEIETFHDHRIAMSFAIAGLIAKSEIHIKGADCANVSYPGFYNILREVTRD